MNSDGGRQHDETTSYQLRPPRPGDATPPPPATAPQTGGAGAGRPAGGDGTDTQLVPPPAPPSAAPPAPAAGGETGAGRLLGGRYRLLERLGHGGMGTVWRARDEVVDREVAVKEPRLPHLVGDEERAMLHARMRREARAAARITHPSVVTVHDVVVEDGQPWLVMELVRGESLDEVMRTGTVEPREAARIGLAVLDALTAAHQAGVLHRDVKPANVLLGTDGQVVLTDFGIAQLEGEQGLTSTGVFVGSPEYTAPERATGQRPGPESDLWSLGVLLYAAVEGFSPFRRSNQPATVQAVMSAEPPAPVRAGEPLAGLLTRLLAKQPAARPGPEEIRRVLTEVAAEPAATVAATRLAPGLPAGAGQPLATPPDRRRTRLAALAGAATGAVLVGTLLLAPFSPASGLGGDGEDSTFADTTWRTHEETDRRYTIQVPDTFKRAPNDEDENRVDYTSRDRLYQVSVWSWEDEEGRSPLDIANDNVDGMRESFGLSDVEGDYGETEFDGRPAAHSWVEYRDAYVPDEYDVVHRDMTLYYAEEGGDHRWQVRVTMPGDRGHAREYGEELYAEIIDSFEIHEDREAGAAGAGG